MNLETFARYQRLAGNNQILSIEKKQRAFDGVWEVIAKIRDAANSYYFKEENGKFMTLMPMRWVVIDTSNSEPEGI